jgi:hypothetical protein
LKVVPPSSLVKSMSSKQPVSGQATELAAVAGSGKLLLVFSSTTCKVVGRQKQ